MSPGRTVPRVAVLVSGSGSNLQALIDDGIQIDIVVSNVAGVRALERAERAGIATAVLEQSAYPDRVARDLALADLLDSRGIGLVVLAGYMHLLTDPFVQRFSGRIVNVHPSLLPAFPGAHAPADALAYGVRWTGATVHLITEDLAAADTGPVVLQEPVAVRENDTVESLHQRIQIAEHTLLPRAVRLFLEGRVAVVPGTRRVSVDVLEDLSGGE
jgi:formyltetrahydrofolate-dependent phosphoribosylglycinamide formyltransferase